MRKYLPYFIDDAIAWIVVILLFFIAHLAAVRVRFCCSFSMEKQFEFDINVHCAHVHMSYASYKTFYGKMRRKKTEHEHKALTHSIHIV